MAKININAVEDLLQDLIDDANELLSRVASRQELEAMVEEYRKRARQILGK